jgi:hypothetical protein
LTTYLQEKALMTTMDVTGRNSQRHDLAYVQGARVRPCIHRRV